MSTSVTVPPATVLAGRPHRFASDDGTRQELPMLRETCSPRAQLSPWSGYISLLVAESLTSKAVVSRQKFGACSAVFLFAERVRYSRLADPGVPGILPVATPIAQNDRVCSGVMGFGSAE